MLQNVIDLNYVTSFEHSFVFMFCRNNCFDSASLQVILLNNIRTSTAIFYCILFSQWLINLIGNKWAVFEAVIFYWSKIAINVVLGINWWDTNIYTCGSVFWNVRFSFILHRLWSGWRVVRSPIPVVWRAVWRVASSKFCGSFKRVRQQTPLTF